MRRTLYNQWSQSLKSKKLHIICWSVFIFYEVSITGVLAGHFSPFLNYLFFYVINIAVFYFHSLVLLPYGLKKSKWYLMPLLLAELGIYIVLILAADKMLALFDFTVTAITWKFFAATVWRGIYFILYGTGYFLLVSHLKNQSRIHEEALMVEKLNNQLLTAKNDLLRSQMNPHLLFNTLNFIRYAAKKKLDSVDEAILTLSEMISFSLDENNHGHLPLANELKQIANLIRLNQLRFDNRLFLNYHTDIADGSRPIIPLVLLTLVENVFKHGDLLKDSAPAAIAISSDKQSLHFRSSNLPAKAESLKSASNNLGLKNIESRLNTYYPGRHVFSHGIEGKMYIVNLSIAF